MEQANCCSKTVQIDGSWDLAEYYLGPIKHLFEMPGVTEIMVNRFDDICIEQNGEIKTVPDAAFSEEEDVVTLIEQIGHALGQPVDSKTHPVLDARLLDGSRVCGVLYPVASNGSMISFRVFPKKQITAEFLVEKGALTAEMLDFLKTAVICRANILVSGSCGSGKTTLLNVISGFIPNGDRIVTVEDTRELRIKAGKHHVPLEAPTRREEEGQKITLEFLLRTTLRLNPTRIILGEMRDAAAATTFLHAVNTGHNASSTIHANGPADALTRIQTLVARHGSLPFDVVKKQVWGNLDLIVHVENTPNHGRRVVSITEINNSDAVELWRWSYRQGVHVRQPAASVLYERLNKYGLEIPN